MPVASRWCATGPTRRTGRYCGSPGHDTPKELEQNLLPRHRNKPGALQHHSFEATELKWRLYGSGALAVRGLDIEPGDIDVNVSDSALAGRIFDDLLITPVLEMRGWVAKHAGRAFYGAILEWLSEPLAENDDVSEPHEQGPFVADQLETLQWRGHCVHVPPLSAQLRTIESRGWSDRADLIRSAMPR